MGVVEEGGKVAVAATEGLAKNPMALALIVINVIFLFGGGWVIHDVADRTAKANERRDRMLGDLIRACRTFEQKENGHKD